jgi:hypothetical protein
MNSSSCDGKNHFLQPFWLLVPFPIVDYPASFAGGAYRASGVMHVQNTEYGDIGRQSD